MHGGLGCVKKDDVVIFVSRGGKTVELLPIIDVCERKGATIIAITENLNSPLARTADITCLLYTSRE